jgi:hypothetical protein
MDYSEHIWNRLFRVDTAVSLLTFGVTTFSGVMEGIPWTYRIPAALVAACAAVWLWRHLTLQRLLMPTKVQPVYENDVITISELFQGRSFIRGVTFRNCEIKGPGTLVLLNPVMRANTFNPNLDVLVVLVPPETNLMPHHQLIECVFEKCFFSGCGIMAIPSFYDWLRQTCGMPPLEGVPKSVPAGDTQLQGTPETPPL